MKPIRLSIYSELRLVESGTGGREWEVCPIRAGFSLNAHGGRPRYYGPKLLRENVHKFNGLPVMEFRFELDLDDHRTDAMVDAYPMGPVGNIIGFLREARWCDADQEVKARFVVNDDRADMRATLRNAHASGATLGFSIDSLGHGSVGIKEGRSAWVVTSLDHIDSLDLVTHPAAGGRMLRLVASQGTTIVYAKLLALMATIRPSWLVGFDTGRLSESASKDQVSQVLPKVLAKLRECRKEFRRGTDRYTEMALDIAAVEDLISMLDAGDIDAARMLLEELKVSEPEAEGEPPPLPLAESRMQIAMREAARDRVERVLIEAKHKGLGDVAAQRVREAFKGRIDVTQEQVETEVRSIRDLIAAANPASTRVTASRIETGDDQRQKYSKAIDGWFARRGGFVSLHEAHRRITGEHDLSKGQRARQMMGAFKMGMPHRALERDPLDGGTYLDIAKRARESRIREAVRVTEATNTTALFAELLGDSFTRRLVDFYNLEAISDWKKMVRIESWDDFRTRRYIKTAGLGDLPVVAEDAAYTEHAVLIDEEETVAPSKRGQLIYFTIEAFQNDDLQGLQRMPEKIGVAAARTIAKLIFNTNLLSNPTLGVDSLALFHATHANLGTTALTSASLEAAILQMEKQVEYGSGESLGGIMRPKYLVVPPELRRTAWSLLANEHNVEATAGTVDTKSYFSQFAMEPLVAHVASDVNNWAIVADPSTAEGMVVGFVDGIEEPQVFVADQENVGAMFTNDRLGFKSRHAYAAVPVDHRAFAGGVVA